MTESSLCARHSAKLFRCVTLFDETSTMLRGIINPILLMRKVTLCSVFFFLPTLTQWVSHKVLFECRSDSEPHVKLYHLWKRIVYQIDYSD